MEAGYIGIAACNTQTFRNTRSNDMVFFTPNPSKFVIGTRSNLNSTVQITGSNMTVNGNLQVTSGAGIQGTTTIFNDLIVRGNIITQQDLVLTGMQVASGASYCNGDLSVINSTIDLPTSNATVNVASLSGIPVLSLLQNSNPDNLPFIIYQSDKGDGYIQNEYNIHHGTSSNVYATMTSNGDIGLGTQQPKARLDILNGNINANNIIRLRKHGESVQEVNTYMYWSSNELLELCEPICIKTTQHISCGDPYCYGTRTQTHHVMLSSLGYDYIPQVAIGRGDHDMFSTLDIAITWDANTSLTITSKTTSQWPMFHIMTVEVETAPPNLGHIWLQ